MEIPMDLLLERLRYLDPKIQVEKQSRWVKGVKLLPGQWKDISCDYFYLCRGEEPFPTETDAILAVVCSGQAPSCLPRNHVLLCTQVPFGDIFNELLGLHLLLQDWDLKLSLSVSQNRGIQHLLDLSEPVLGNPVVVTDAACKCIASTSSFESDDPLFSQWLSQGYLSKDNFDILKQSEAYMGEELYSGQSVVLPVSPIKRYVNTFTPVLSQDRSQVRYEISMEFCNTPYSDGLFQLYCYLVEKLMAYLQEEDPEQHTRYDCFLHDVLNGHCSDGAEIQERAACFLGEDLRGYNVLIIWQKENSDMYRKHAIFTLRLLFPQSQPVLYQDKLVMILPLGATRQGMRAGVTATLDRLTEFLESEDAYGGISDPMESCHDIWRAFHHQAVPALELGLKLRDRRDDQSCLFWYADCRLYRLIEAAHAQIPAREMINDFLLRIVDYDRSRQTAYFRTLCTYLRLERNFTDTAAALHLHRNTVIYQIHRIQELFSLDLSDQELRLQILMAERILEIYSWIAWGGVEGELSPPI